MDNGLSFVDDSEMSVREKIDRYFRNKERAIPESHEESTSDESISNSFNGLVSFNVVIFVCLRSENVKTNNKRVVTVNDFL